MDEAPNAQQTQRGDGLHDHLPQPGLADRPWRWSSGRVQAASGEKPRHSGFQSLWRDSSVHHHRFRIISCTCLHPLLVLSSCDRPQIFPAAKLQFGLCRGCTCLELVNVNFRSSRHSDCDLDGPERPSKHGCRHVSRNFIPEIIPAVVITPSLRPEHLLTTRSTFVTRSMRPPEPKSKRVQAGSRSFRSLRATPAVLRCEKLITTACPLHLPATWVSGSTRPWKGCWQMSSKMGSLLLRSDCLSTADTICEKSTSLPP